MARDFSKLEKDMKNLALSFEKKANKLVVDVAANAGIEIANENPVDTGLSSGNWQGVIGSESIEDREFETLMPPSSESRMNMLRSQKKQSGESVFVANAVDYVPKIIYEGTKTAPEMWATDAAKISIKRTLNSYKGRLFDKQMRLEL